MLRSSCVNTLQWYIPIIMYVYIYMCVCVCIHVYIYMCVCVYIVYQCISYHVCCICNVYLCILIYIVHIASQLQSHLNRRCSESPAPFWCCYDSPAAIGDNLAAAYLPLDGAACWRLQHRFPTQRPVPARAARSSRWSRVSIWRETRTKAWIDLHFSKVPKGQEINLSV